TTFCHFERSEPSVISSAANLLSFRAQREIFRISRALARPRNDNADGHYDGQSPVMRWWPARHEFLSLPQLIFEI
ncbi:hypothetical protein, partial [Chloroflexus sp.]|uniref:hypothetical protein n=1 Tax=Chloroflexus sp. TaxID=1904827 RepID=UPI003C796549